MKALLAMCLIVYLIFWLLAAATVPESALYQCARAGMTGSATGGLLLLFVYIASHW